MGRTGSLFIVSGPSGAGKSAIAAALLGSVSSLQFSISYTTRAPRGQEANGVEYHFVSKEEFESLICDGSLLEWAEVYGNLYGTSKKVVRTILASGNDVLLDIDVQGAKRVRTQCPDAISVFILPPSYLVLRQRLEQRQLDRDYVIEQRLKIAGQEIRHYRDYDYLIINEDLERSIEDLRAIITGSRCRLAVRSEAARMIVATFGGVDD
jgi:guanylate kinase